MMKDLVINRASSDTNRLEQLYLQKEGMTLLKQHQLLPPVTIEKRLYQINKEIALLNGNAH